MCKKNISKEVKWLLLGIPVIFIASAIFHFVYGWTGNNKVVGMFFPANESIFEHLKMLIFPIIIWWTAIYFAKGKELNIDKNKWFFGCLVSLVASMLFMMMFYYTITGALGIESLALDIANTFLSIAFGQLLGIHFYKHSKGIEWNGSWAIIIVIVAVCIWFSLNPPELPMFLDATTGTYGIK